MIVPESTRIKQKNGMIKEFEERIQGRRSGLVIQLQIKALSREAEVQMEWTIYSGIKHTIWGSDT